MFCMNTATLLKISAEEMPLVADVLSIDNTIGHKEFSRILKERCPNLKIIVVTLGDKGAYCYDCRSDQEYGCESQNVMVASTVGAGDSFSAAFLYR